MKITLFTGKTFDIQEALGFKIKVVKSPLARRLTLRIDSKEHLPVLSLPLRCSEKRAVEFVKNHQDWINVQLARLPQAKKFEEGESISLFGENLTIIHTPQTRLGVKIEGNNLLVSGDIEFLHRRITDFIKKTAQQKFYTLSLAKAQLIDCPLNAVCIKDTKSRWGSCSSKNNINYNWRVAMAPDYVIDYLISHEVAHLKHQDHSHSFWNCVKTLCPHYTEGRAWLKVKGRDLYLYE